MVIPQGAKAAGVITRDSRRQCSTSNPAMSKDANDAIDVLSKRNTLEPTTIRNSNGGMLCSGRGCHLLARSDIQNASPPQKTDLNEFT